MCDTNVYVTHNLFHLQNTQTHSHVVYNPAVRRFLDGYLRYATRPHEARLHAATSSTASTATTTTEPPAAADPASEALRRALALLVLLAHLRLCTDAGSVDALTRDGAGGTKAEELLREAVDVPKLLDLAALYGFTEPALLSRCLQAACRLRPGLARAEWPAALAAAMPVLADVNRVLAGAVGAVGKGGQSTQEDASSSSSSPARLLDDRLEYLADVAAAFSRVGLAVPDQLAPALADPSGAGPALLKALRGAYGRLVQLEAAPDEVMAGPGSVEALLARGRRRRGLARFARKCILALLNAVVDGMVAVAAQAGRRGAGRARAAEWLFSLLGGLLDAEAETGAEEAVGPGPEEGRLIQDCIHQRHGGLRERVRKLLASGEAEEDEAAANVRYLLQLLDAAAEAGREEALARAQRRAGEEDARGWVMDGWWLVMLAY